MFVREIVATLEESHRCKDFDALVVVAPPKILGDLRAPLSRELSRIVIAEVDKYLTRVPTRELTERLRDVVSL